MTFLLWVITLIVGCLLVILNGWPPGSAGHPAFWHRWEFLAAASVGAYNLLIFPVVFYSPGDLSLDSVLRRAPSKVWIFWFRFLLPALLLTGVCYLVWIAAALPGPAPTDQMRWKLYLTFGAFLSFLFGDFIMLLTLRGLFSGGARTLERSVADHIRYVDLPFAIAYFVLIRIYATNVAPSDPGREIQLQAFLGGASAFEMLVQSTIHAFSTVGEPH